MGVTTSGRGFQQGDEIPSQYGGYIKVYESSAASSPHVWARIECPADLNDPQGPTVEAVAHLTLENAKELRDQLSRIIGNHYQLPVCDRHGGVWGESRHCPRCTWLDGTPRKPSELGPLTDG